MPGRFTSIDAVAHELGVPKSWIEACVVAGRVKASRQGGEVHLRGHYCEKLASEVTRYHRLRARLSEMETDSALRLWSSHDGHTYDLGEVELEVLRQVLIERGIDPPDDRARPSLAARPWKARRTSSLTCWSAFLIVGVSDVFFDGLGLQQALESEARLLTFWMTSAMVILATITERHRGTMGRILGLLICAIAWPVITLALFCVVDYLASDRLLRSAGLQGLTFVQVLSFAPFVHWSMRRSTIFMRET